MVPEEFGVQPRHSCAGNNARSMSSPLRLTFVKSAAEVDQLPDTVAEISLAGRSNVGKSTLLNALANTGGLAKVSSKPGRTQLLNFFTTPDGTSVVDLPGYGYASSASQTTREAWLRRMETYLLHRRGLVLTLLLVDAEVGPTKLDLEVLGWLRRNGVPFQVVATKFDKVKAPKRDRRRKELCSAAGVAGSDIVWVSAAKGTGLDELRGLVRDVLSGQ